VPTSGDIVHRPLVHALIFLAACTNGGGVATLDTTGSTDSGDTGPDAPRMTVTTSGPIVCVDPAAREEAYFDEVLAPGENEKPAWFWGGGILTGDLDGDGHFEIILPGFYRTDLYRGQPGGGFALDDTALQGLPVAAASGGSFADYDGDGDLDVLITRFRQSNTLLRNDDGVLVDVSTAAGLPQDKRRTMGSSWGDLDGDGDLDLFLGNYGYIDQESDDPDHEAFEPAEPSWLLLNDGDGTFTDVSERLPQQVHDGYTFTGGFLDVDRDGDEDLYVVNDFGNSFPNVLLQNQGDGTLVLGDQLGLDIAMTGMGLGVGDLNGDGFPDMAMTAWNGNWLVESALDGTLWVDFSDAVGFENDLTRTQKVGWGVELVDMDNDGDLDAPMAYGYLDSTYQASTRQPDALYLQTDDGTFVDVGPAWGLNHPTIGRGFAAVDANDDGWIDIIKRDLEGPTIYAASRCGTASWLRVRLHQPTGMNRFAVGAHVRVVTGSSTQERTVFAGTINHASGGPPEVHFGLGGNDLVDRIEVTWPDGTVDTMAQLDGAPIAARQILDLTRATDEGSSPGSVPGR